MGNFPCKDCGSRHIGCHSTCEAYIAAKADRDKFNEKLHEERKVRQGIYEQQARVRRYVAKSNHHRGKIYDNG